MAAHDPTGHEGNARTIALFGLSADPPTGFGGHVGIALWCANDLQPDEAAPTKRVDEVWVLPVYRHMFANKQAMTSYAHRLAMSRLAFEDLPQARAPIRVVETERELGAATSRPIGTVDVLTHLHARHPHTRFLLVLGADSYADLRAGRWRNAAQIERLAEVVVVPRVGYAQPKPCTTLLTPFTDISSSAARASSDPRFLAQALQPQVVEYILQHGLYAVREHGRR